MDPDEQQKPLESEEQNSKEVVYVSNEGEQFVEVIWVRKVFLSFACGALFNDAWGVNSIYDCYALLGFVCTLIYEQLGTKIYHEQQKFDSIKEGPKIRNIGIEKEIDLFSSHSHCYKTKEEAEQAIVKFKEALKNIVAWRTSEFMHIVDLNKKKTQVRRIKTSFLQRLQNDTIIQFLNDAIEQITYAAFLISMHTNNYWFVSRAPRNYSVQFPDVNATKDISTILVRIRTQVDELKQKIVKFTAPTPLLTEEAFLKVYTSVHYMLVALSCIKKMDLPVVEAGNTFNPKDNRDLAFEFAALLYYEAAKSIVCDIGDTGLSFTPEEATLEATLFLRNEYAHLHILLENRKIRQISPNEYGITALPNNRGTLRIKNMESLKKLLRKRLVAYAKYLEKRVQEGTPPIEPQTYDAELAKSKELPQNLVHNLTSAGRTCHPVSREGNCQFLAVSVMLQKVQKIVSAEQLRKDVIQYLRDHPNMQVITLYSLIYRNINKSFKINGAITWSQFVEQNGETTEEYLKRMSQVNEWGDVITLHAMSQICYVNIVLITDDKDHPVQMVSVAQPTDTLYLSYITNVHYDATDDLADVAMEADPTTIGKM